MNDLPKTIDTKGSAVTKDPDNEKLTQETTELPSLIGTSIGNIEIIDRLGAGGMGEVYLGVDHRLDRRVALKTLHAQLELSSATKVRFRREAQILSRLDHPGICRLYDLVEDEQDYLILEYVQGKSLEELSGQLPKDEVIRVGRDIAEALAAAHREGVIHRDLKPDNVMLDEHGSIKILDFGISRLVGGDREYPDDPKANDAICQPRSHPASPDLTEHGTIVGTPRYMSPEQIQGLPLTPAADVYSLGLLLCELLTGASPLSTLDLPSLLGRDPEEPLTLPEDIDRHCRSLFESMTQADPLKRPDAAECARRLDHIRSAPQRRRRKILVAGLSLTAIAAIIGALSLGQAMGKGRHKCRDFGRHLEGVWDHTVADNLQKVFVTSDALGAWPSVKSAFDAYAEKWIALRTEACEATWMRGEQTPEMLDLEMACFDRRLADLEALLEVFSDNLSSIKDKAALAAHSLPPLMTCLDTRLLSARVPLPEDPVTIARVQAVREDLSRIKARLDAGDFGRAWEQLQALERDVTAIDHSPLTAEYRYLEGLLGEKLGAPAEADHALMQAILAGESGRHDRKVAQAWIRRVWIHGPMMSDFEGADELAGFAEAAITRSGDDPELEGALANHQAIILFMKEQPKEALAVCRQALDLRRKAFGPEHPKVASTMQNCAQLLEGLGQFEEALELMEEAFQMRLSLLGPNHPSVLHSLTGLSQLLGATGRKDEAEAYLHYAIQLAEDILPPGHVNLGLLKNNLSVVAIDAEQYSEAADLAREAASLLRTASGPQSLNTADALSNIAVSTFELGQYQETEETAAAALEIYRRHFGENNKQTIKARLMVTLAHLKMENFDAARSALQPALTSAPVTVPNTYLLFLVRFAEAKILVANGEETQRAAMLGRQLLQDLEANPSPKNDTMASEIKTWLLLKAKNADE